MNEELLICFQVFALLTIGLLLLFLNSVLKSEQNRYSGKLARKFAKLIETAQQNTKLSFSAQLFICGICGAIGVATGIVLNNVLLCICLAIGLFAAPLAVMRIKQATYRRTLEEQLEMVISLITNSYLQNEDIVKAIRDNLHRIDPPFHDIFEQFITELRLADSSIPNALIRMRTKFKHQYFTEWCDVLIQCQNDRELKYVLPPIVESLNDAKKMQIELDTVMRMVWRDYIIIALIAVAQIPMIRMMNIDWYRILTETIPGKVTVVILFLSVFVSAFIVSRINKPIDDL